MTTDSRPVADYSGDLEPWEAVAEKPKGDEVEIPYIGWTREFSASQLETAKGMMTRNIKHGGFLDYHVPLNMRGTYKLGPEGPLLGEPVHPGSGYAGCKGVLKAHKNNRMSDVGRPCRSKAINHSGYCSVHGGALCPLDKKVIDWSKAPRAIRWRYKRLPVSELDDEELARGQIRNEDGSWTNAEYVSAEMHDEMVKKLFDRADQKMREGLMDMVNTMLEIANGTAYEPADRLRAAEFVFKWLRGNQPVKVEIGIDKPFEQVIAATFKGGSRSESRAARGIDEDDVMDAEVVDDALDLPALGSGDSYAGDNDLLGDVGDKEDSLYDYTDPRDHNLHTDLQPKPVEHYGAAGKLTHDVPDQPEARHEHFAKAEKNIEDSRIRRDKIFKKRPSTPDEIAQARKEHKENMKKGIAKRKAFLNMGKDKLPVSAEITIEEVINDEGEEVTLVGIYDTDDLFEGDLVKFRVDTSVLLAEGDSQS